MSVPTLFLLALVSAALMGLAIQRGATCLVTAIDELVAERRPARFVAMLEASSIVAGGLVLARLAGHLTMNPPTYAVTVGTVAGGMLLGLGAFVTRACVVGAIARLGAGEWAFVLVPGGFYLGSLAAAPLLAIAPPVALPSASPLIDHAALLAGPVVLLAGWRLSRTLRALRRGQLAAYVWSPHVATGVIGLTFLVLLLSVGEWSYTGLLSDAAHGMASGLAGQLALVLALFAGAVAGGWSSGSLSPRAPVGPAMLRCLVGGVLLGAGSALVPGGNDGLLLVGLPLLRLYAWVAMVSMALTVGAAMVVERRLLNSFAIGLP